MDEDDDYIGEEESPDSNDETSGGEPSTYQEAARDEIFRLSPSKHHGALDHHTKKWLRFKKHYCDRYLELLNATYAPSSEDEALEDGQLGSVRWTTVEKGTFFSALQRKGRHDVAGIAAAIGTKSEVEVLDYLNHLKDAESERQMFAPHAKNVAIAQIEAAIEIGDECEAMLENTADALAAYQECYDQVAARHQRIELQLIDTDAAERLDSVSDSADICHLDEGEVDEVQLGDNPGYRLFHLSNFLELSRVLFMNIPQSGAHAHWTELVEGNESPSIASDAINMFYLIVENIVRRVVQTAIFLAKSRIRAIEATGLSPAQVLKEMDIEAALDILNMEPHGFDYWAGWVKRSKVQVVSGSKVKGQSDRKVLDVHQVEEILSIRASRGRSQSLSSLISMTSTDTSRADENELSVQSSAINEEDLQKSPKGASQSPSSELFTAPDGDSTSEGSESGDSEIQDGSDNFKIDTENALHATRHQIRGGKRHRNSVDDEEDEYMERLDQSQRRHEERYLHQILGQPEVKAESPGDPDRYPNIRRKRKNDEDLLDWSSMEYRALWERITQDSQQITTTNSELQY